MLNNGKILNIGVDMSLKLPMRIISFALLLGLLSSCYHPPFNDFLPYNPVVPRVIGGTAVGAAAAGIAYGTVAGALIGGAAGGAIGAIIGYQHESKSRTINELRKMDIQFISYGDTLTLVVPTDKYFMFNSPRLNEVCFPGLEYIVKLLKFYPESCIYVAAFTDNVGSYQHKKLLSQAQAETMMTFLWGHGIHAELFKSEGYGDKNDISDNKLIHGSAQNRRIEIQWLTNLHPAAPVKLSETIK